MVGSMDAVHSV